MDNSLIRTHMRIRTIPLTCLLFLTGTLSITACTKRPTSVVESAEAAEARHKEATKLRNEDNARLAMQDINEMSARAKSTRGIPSEAIGDVSGYNTAKLGTQGGVFTIAGRLNDVLTLDFVVDSGAADVHIPADVASTLLRTHTINQGDFLPGAIYTMADGSKARSQRFIIRKLQVGNTIVRNVPAAIGNSKGDLLLGQSFLSRFPSWSIDNKSHRLILGGQEQ